MEISSDMFIEAFNKTDKLKLCELQNRLGVNKLEIWHLYRKYNKF
jgi:hypothetical protein